VVRLSGPEAEAIARRRFRPRRERPRFQSHRFYLGHFLDAEGRVVDEVLLTLMRAPHSYTREDVVEIHCHSGPQVLREILAGVLKEGARLARPGEFTLRAFLSGRLSLPQAEAVLEVIEAQSGAALRVAQEHLAGGLGRRLAAVRENLLAVLARVEAALDFPEEAEDLDPETLAGELAPLAGELARLAATYREGRLLKEGVRVVLAGRPNVGKSSLLNRLLEEERAIVTDIPGTTRDLIEEAVSWQGVLLRLTDTAGLRSGGDVVEELGMARTRERLAIADLILYLVDHSQPLAAEDRQHLAELAGRRGFVVVNKADLPRGLDEEELADVAPFPVLKLSALTGAGVEALKDRMVAAVLEGGVPCAGEIITQARHKEHLEAAVAHLEAAVAHLRGSPLWELVAEDLRSAREELGRLTGETAGDDLLEEIFSRFCIGK
jgi:tRNA modification GTPase